MKAASSLPSVLVASAEPDVRREFEAFLRKSGWTYEVADNSWPALVGPREGSYDFIVTDLAIPGLEALNLMKSPQTGQACRVVLVVPEDETRHSQLEPLKDRAVSFIQKPLDPALIERTLSRLLRTLRQSSFEHTLYRHISEETVTMVFSSREASTLTVPLPVVTRLYAAGRIDLATKLRIELAFQEALTNSIDHGNLGLRSEWREEIDAEGRDTYSKLREERLADPNYAARSVSIVSKLEADRLLISIRDEGAGFLNAVGAGARPTDVSCHGRGMRIIASNMDEVSYHNNGREIVLVKYL